MPSHCPTIYRCGRVDRYLVVYWTWMRAKSYSVWMALKVAFWSRCSVALGKWIENTRPVVLNHKNVMHFLITSANSDGFFAAASFMSFQQCRFNFGSEPFKYPPKNRAFDSFNGHAVLKPQDKIVLPRHLFLEQLRKLSVREDSCTLCFDSKGTIRIEPCKHR